MLEYQALLLRPWTPAAGPHQRREILDAVTGQRLGFADRTRSPRTWLRWFTRPLVAVHEIEDEPLLLLIHPLWGWVSSWDVRDADNHRVGVCRGAVLQDRFGSVLAVLEPPSEGASWQFRRPDGVELGTLALSREGTRLTFGDILDDNPFAKMILLAKALSGE